MAKMQSQRERLREQRKAEQKKHTSRLFLAMAGVLLVILIIFLISRLSGGEKTYEGQNGFSLGDPNALIKVEEFSDFRCSHCRDFSELLEPDFLEKYIATGKVYLTFHNFPFLADDSYDAAEAAYCAADQNAFWQYKSALFSVNKLPGAYSETKLLGYAKDLGLDQDIFKTCLQSDVHLQDITADKDYASRLGVDSTPQFSVNGTLVYSPDLESTVEAQLANQ